MTTGYNEVENVMNVKDKKHCRMAETGLVVIETERTRGAKYEADGIYLVLDRIVIVMLETGFVTD